MSLMITTRGLPENVSTGGGGTAWAFTECTINRTNIQQPIAERSGEIWGFQSNPAETSPNLMAAFINSTALTRVFGSETSCTPGAMGMIFQNYKPRRR
jgi:hypothetical protein